MDNPHGIVATRFFRVSVTITALLFFGPFLYYTYARLTGNLPSSTVWFAHGNNHGPWREELPGLFVYLPFVLLIPGTFIYGGVLAMVRQQQRYLLAALILIGIQATCVWGHLRWLFWTID